MNILVIRLGALGDLLLCMKPFQDIRAAFPRDSVSLLTGSAFAGFARTLPWFDAVIADPRRPLWRVDAAWRVGMDLRAGNFGLVFDLQNKPRTALYRRLFVGGHVDWSGTLKGCSHFYTPSPEKIHRQEDVLGQLRAAGVGDSGPLNLDWLSAPVDDLRLPERYAVLVPGSSPGHPYKRWPPGHYAALAHRLKEKGLDVLLAGAKDDAGAIAAIRAEAGFARDLSGQTSLALLASVFRGCALAVGNDTGPMFLPAMLGRPSLTLFSGATDPARCGPLGPRCGWLKRGNLADLPVEEVLRKISTLPT